jgi:hypothetical protein
MWLRCPTPYQKVLLSLGFAVDCYTFLNPARSAQAGCSHAANLEMSRHSDLGHSLGVQYIDGRESIDILRLIRLLRYDAQNPLSRLS